MTKKLIDYLIWFHQNNGEAIIIDQYNHTFGRLDKENAELVEEVVLTNTNVVYQQITK
ncbi:MAG: hypothetical protein ACI35O_04470 [Bacillaceae bacterium]